jgi:hypothetical protein
MSPLRARGHSALRSYAKSSGHSHAVLILGHPTWVRYSAVDQMRRRAERVLKLQDATKALEKQKLASRHKVRSMGGQNYC